MPLLDRYLAKEILLPFAAGLLFLIQLLLATQLLAQANVLFGSGVSLLDVGEVILDLFPYFMGFVLPIAFLLGVVLGVSRLAGDREVVALSAAGLSPVRLVRVPLLLAALVGAFGVWLAVEVEPAGMRAASRAFNEILKRNLTGDVQGGVFYEQIPGYTLYAEKVRGGEWQHVLIHDASLPDAPMLALAQGGKLLPVEGGGDLELVLQQGEVHRDASDRAGYATAAFERAQLVLGLGRALSDRNSLARPSRERDYGELRGDIAAAYALRTEQGDTQARRLEGYLHRKIGSALAVLAFALLGVPLAASPRVGRSFGIGATFLLMVAHYILLRSGEVMAQRGQLPAWLSLELPNLVLGGVGILLLGVLAWRGTGAVR